MFYLLLTGVFPFDVWQVGRAGVADGETLLGHSLISIHVHEVSRHWDLRGEGGQGETLPRDHTFTGFLLCTC